VLIDKLPAIRTVVNKTGETGGPFRTFQMEAGA
jgi:tRNA G37 N-methylase Trm5